MDMHYEPRQNESSILDKFTVNLTQKARTNGLDPVIGRNEEIRRVMQILARRTKNNPVLLGDPGVGKTAVVEGLAQRIALGDVPSTLKNRELLSLDMASLVAGSAFRGEFEDRLKKLLKEIQSQSGQYILFMDELHTLVGAGAAGGSMDAANILKPALARGELHAIGATTVKEYRQFIEKDQALERRFQPVYLTEPTPEDALAILRGLKEKYEVHHGIRITDDALAAAVGLSVRYITDRFLPDKAIDLIDEAASGLKIDTESMPLILDELKRQITQFEIERTALKREKDAQKRLSAVDEAIAKARSREKTLEANWNREKELIAKLQKARVSIDGLRLDLTKAENEALLDRAAEIKYGRIPAEEKRIAGLESELGKIPAEERLLREEVTDEDVARVVSRWSGIPVTRLLSSEAEKLVNLTDELKKRVVGQDEALIKVANAIRRSRAGIAEEGKPIGSFLFLGPTGVGKTETARALAEYLFNDEKNLVRIDMSEYQEPHTVARLIGAPPGYIGYDEGGQLTEAVRRKPYAVVLLDEIEKAHPQVFNTLLQVLDDGRLTDGRGRTVSFKNTVLILTSNTGSNIIKDYQGKSEKKVREMVLELVGRTFRPEFLNRLDALVIYRSLTKGQIRVIVDIQLGLLARRLAKQGISVKFTEVLAGLIAETGFDPVYGARPVKRVIQDRIADELALEIIERKIAPGAEVTVDVKNGKVEIRFPN